MTTRLRLKLVGARKKRLETFAVTDPAGRLLRGPFSKAHVTCGERFGKHITPIHE